MADYSKYALFPDNWRFFPTNRAQVVVPAAMFAAGHLPEVCSISGVATSGRVEKSANVSRTERLVGMLPVAETQSSRLGRRRMIALTLLALGVVLIVGAAASGGSVGMGLSGVFIWFGAYAFKEVTAHKWPTLRFRPGSDRHPPLLVILGVHQQFAEAVAARAAMEDGP